MNRKRERVTKMNRHERLAKAKPSMMVKYSPLTGYYGVATVAGKTVHGTANYKTEQEAWNAIQLWAKERAAK